MTDVFGQPDRKTRKFNIATYLGGQVSPIYKPGKFQTPQGVGI